jgi:YesN/AraC family two-component response regulator
MKNGFINSWMHFHWRGIESLTEECEIPVNQEIKTNNPNFCAYYISEIATENLYKKPLYEKKMTQLFEEMMIMLAREYRGYNNSLHYHIPHRNELVKLREYILTNYTQKQTLKELASRLNLSTSRFCSLYKAAFNSSPIEDLVNKRVNDNTFAN